MSKYQQNADRTPHGKTGGKTGGKGGKGSDRNSRKVTAQQLEAAEIDQLERTGGFSLMCEKLEPQTLAQKRYLAQLRDRSVVYVFGMGDAGSGKTYLGTRHAIEQLANKRVRKIYCTRPAKEVEGEELGFLPGELGDKFEPYLTPLIEIFNECIRPGVLKYLRDSKVIEPVPLGFMRGRTFRDCIVLVDEAQNITPKQAKMLATRLGENAQMIFTGDIGQMDIEGESGLGWLWARMKGLSMTAGTTFVPEDSVRSGFMKEVLVALAGPTAESPTVGELGSLPATSDV